MFSLLLISQKKQTSKGAGGLKLVRLHGDITFLTLIFPVFQQAKQKLPSGLKLQGMFITANLRRTQLIKQSTQNF